MTTDRQKESHEELRALPRKKWRRHGSGHCIACDSDGPTFDDLCDECYGKSNDGLPDKTRPEGEKP